MAPVSQNRPLTGIFWMIVTGLCFIGVTAVVKHVGPAIPAAQGAFMRYLLGLVFLLPVLGELRHTRPSPRQLRLLGVRGAVHAFGVIAWFFAMTQITISEVVALNYLSPVYVTIGAAFVLGERVAARRILAVLAALVGALIILRPGFREISVGHLAILGTGASFATGYLIAKVLSSEMSANAIVAGLSLVVTPLLLPFALAVWVPTTWEDWAWYMAVAAFATGGHYAMTFAFAAAPVTTTQPVTFLQLIWAALLGAVVFGEPIDGFVLTGGAIILAAITFIAWREARLARSKKPSTAAAAGPKQAP